MTTPWFDPNAWAWLPGTAFGCLGGLWGALAGTLAPKGKARGLVLGVGLALAAVAAGLLTASIVAYLQGQPYGIWYGMGLPGLQGLVLVPILLPVVGRVYRQAEERKMSARDVGG